MKEIYKKDDAIKIAGSEAQALAFEAAGWVKEQSEEKPIKPKKKG